MDHCDNRLLVQLISRSQAADNTTAIFDTDLGWNVSNRGTTSKKMVSLKSAGGQWPTAGGSEVINLPLNCVITKISLFLRSGAVTSGAVVTFSVKTNEATPAVLATTPSFTYSAGTNVNTDNINFVAHSDLKRNVKLLASASVDQFTTEGYCLIEYIG